MGHVQVVCLGADLWFSHIPRHIRGNACDCTRYTRDLIERIHTIAPPLAQTHTSCAENRSSSHRDVSARLNGGFAIDSRGYALRRWRFAAKSRECRVTVAVEDACSQWCCENVVWLSSFWDSGAPKADSSRLMNDLSFHRILFLYAVCEVSYSVLNLTRTGIRSVFLM